MSTYFACMACHIVSVVHREAFYAFSFYFLTFICFFSTFNQFLLFFAHTCTSGVPLVLPPEPISVMLIVAPAEMSWRSSSISKLPSFFVLPLGDVSCGVSVLLNRRGSYLSCWATISWTCIGYFKTLSVCAFPGSRSTIFERWLLQVFPSNLWNLNGMLFLSLELFYLL